MAFTKSRSRDANRYGKKYPIVNVPPRPVLVTQGTTYIETFEIAFNGESSVAHNFKESFPNVPIVTATAVDSGSNDTANVNVFIRSVNKFQVVIGVSNTGFNGTVMVQAISV
jgi:hypothetical protein